MCAVGCAPIVACVLVVLVRSFDCCCVCCCCFYCCRHSLVVGFAFLKFAPGACMKPPSAELKKAVTQPALGLKRGREIEIERENDIESKCA